jgi:hypothetical protein
MNDTKKLIAEIREKAFLAAIPGYASAGLEPSIVMANAKDISNQLSIDNEGNITILSHFCYKVCIHGTLQSHR